MNNPIDIAGLRKFIAWHFLTKSDMHQDKVEWFLTAIGTFDIDTLDALRRLLKTSSTDTLTDLYHFSIALSEWQPDQEDLCFLCGAAELMGAK